MPNINTYSDQSQLSLRPYTSYVAMLGQTGTDAPVATELENTIGAQAPTLISIGIYNIETTIPNEDQIDKVYVVGVSKPYTLGTGVIEITDEGSIKGYLIFAITSTFAIYVSIAIYVYNASWQSVDLSTLIGNGKLCLPEVRYYFQ